MVWKMASNLERPLIIHVYNSSTKYIDEIYFIFGKSDRISRLSMRSKRESGAISEFPVERMGK